MPNQKDCIRFNDLTMLNRCMSEGRMKHAQQRFGAIRRMDDRADREMLRQERRQQRWNRVLDVVLTGVCLLELAVLVACFL